MKRSFGFLLVFFLLFSLLPAKVSALDVSAEFACVMDGVTGRVLFEKNAYEKHSMASTTKIMTALLALEKGNADDIVTVSVRAAGTEGSSIYLKAGEKIKLLDLLYGLMLESGNDAAIAIAEHIGGSVEEFARMMTKKAHSIGAKNTSFKNPNGLDEDGHYTTAYDLALITKYALDNELFLKISSTKTKNISNGIESYMRVLTNHNKMLRVYPDCIGVKTGYTKKTGRCLVSAAERKNFRVIAVTLNAPNDWNDHKKMLNYAYDTYSQKPLIIKDMVMKTIPVKNGSADRLELIASDNFYISLSEEEGLTNLGIEYKTPSSIEAPIKKGAIVGSIIITYSGKPIKEIELLAGIDIDYSKPPRKKFFDNIKKIFSKLFQQSDDNS